MAFNIFQTATATMKKITTDGSGDESVSSSFTVEVDPVLGLRRTFSKDGEQIEGRETIISPHDSIDITHRKWEITFNGHDYQVEEIVPFYKIATDDIDHYEVVLR